MGQIPEEATAVSSGTFFYSRIAVTMAVLLGVASESGPVFERLLVYMTLLNGNTFFNQRLDMSVHVHAAPVESPKKLAKPRLDYLDISRGIIIILVVLFHSHYDPASYIGWFRMPSLFIVSGLLFKLPNQDQVWSFLKKRTLNLLVPYFAYAAIVLAILIVKDQIKIISTAHGITDILYQFPKVFIQEWLYKMGTIVYGGYAIEDSVVVAFWFINCLCLTIIFFTFIKLKIKSDLAVLGIIALLFVAGIVLTNTVTVALPWGLNLSFIALSFFAMGYYAQQLVRKINDNLRSSWPLFILLLGICVGLIVLSELKLFTFLFSFRGGQFPYPVLTLIIPPFYTLLILMIAMYLAKSKLQVFFSYIGTNTLAILYLHMTVGMWIHIIYHTFFHQNSNPFIWTALSIAIPLIFASYFDRYQWTKMVFLGKNSGDVFDYLKKRKKFSVAVS